MTDVNPVTVKILGAEYHVTSPADQIAQLEKAAKELDRRMREIKSAGRIVGTERIAVMAALNLAYELMQQASDQPASESGDTKIADRIKILQKEIDSALATQTQMELT
ncbi:MAG: cell division protein ZapA [Gammaproteobacteria bacterium]|nr:cell division protein ZapA [Gammaproteobacteria bacterium]MDH5628870.1 cell division protein ZapA [Gammaproteobacteria bacterium]